MDIKPKIKSLFSFLVISIPFSVLIAVCQANELPQRVWRDGEEIENVIAVKVKENDIDALIKLLEDNDPRVRRSALYALGELKPEKYEDKIAKFLNDGDGYVRSASANVIGQLGAYEYVDEIAKLLDDEHRWAKVEALRALGMLRGKKYVKKIAGLLDDPSVSGVAAMALSQLQAREYMGRIVNLLQDEQDANRQSALKALRELHAIEYADQIQVSLRDTFHLNRAEAAMMLAEFGRKDLISNIAILLQERPIEFNAAPGYAALALAKLGAKEYVADMTAVLKATLLLEGTYATDSITINNVQKAIILLIGEQGFLKELQKMEADKDIQENTYVKGKLRELIGQFESNP